MLQRLIRPLKGVVSHGLGPPVRRIHIPTRLQFAASPTQATTIFTKVLQHIGEYIRTPGGTRSISSTSVARKASSISARVTLASRPFGAPHLPRAPRVPGKITHVGLGTARNFSTGRPIFQHLVENIPVTGRAFYELDWDVKMRLHQREAIRNQQKASTQHKHVQKRTINSVPLSIVFSRENEEQEQEESVQHYFQTPPPASVVTYLQIPLAPTPTTQAPLSSTAMPHLLSLPAIAKEHAKHSKHAIRVSSLFRRLDAARVWARGASCETYGDPSGLCTVLRIKFEGWSESMVEEVLGDAGRDWCSLQEVAVTRDDTARTSAHTELSPNGHPADSLIIPTVDVSAPSTDSGSVYDDTVSDEDRESEFSYIPTSPESSAWDSGMDEFDTPPLAGLELANPEEEWLSVARVASTNQDSVYFTPSHEGSLFLTLGT